MARSLHQRRTKRIKSLDRGSRRPHSASIAAFCSGVLLLKEKSMGTACSETQAAGVASKVTFGSWPRNAERRKRKAPLLTRASVQLRSAAFCRRRWSVPCNCSGRQVRPPRRGCARVQGSIAGEMVATTSTSGTATPLAVPLPRLPCAKPMTSTSGMMLRNSRRATSANRAATRRVSSLGATCSTSSCTSSSQRVAESAGLATGKSVGLRTSCVGARTAGRLWPAAARRSAPGGGARGLAPELQRRARGAGGSSQPGASGKGFALRGAALGGDTLRQHMSA
mmetsp:Transcript_4522/g.12779  ORF Transcript_4522/g.12779 Transcript_4522/m.12779 type:complete len:281 (-) Transcript_4522:324-1166(-)